MPPPFLCAFEKTVTLAAGVAQTVTVPINGARNWSIVVKNVGSTNPLTGVTISVSPLGTLFDAATAITAGIPLAAGSSMPAILGSAEPVSSVALSLTSTSGTDVSVEAAGW